MGSFQDFLAGFVIAMSPEHLLVAFIGCVVGTFVGLLPGIGSVAGLAILLPLTYHLSPTSAIIMLSAIFYGTYYGGTITTILMRVPADAASVVTMIDGHAMAQRGRAGAALSIAAIGSWIGGTVSVMGLVLLAPVLAEAALQFGPMEFFALLMLGLSMVVFLAGQSMLKAIAMALFGLILGSIGTDPTVGTPRLTFGMTPLLGGIDFVAVLMGLFGLSEVMLAAQRPSAAVLTRSSLDRIYPTRQELKESSGAIGRGTVIGFLLGLIPGTGQVLASFVAYGVERAVARNPSHFGKGAIQGVAGPETANNAHANAALIPLFTLGIPSSASVAILLGAFIIHGLPPGPLLFEQHPEVVWPIIASMIIGNFILLILNLPLVGMWIRILQIPEPVLRAVIVLFICIGTYVINNSVFDVWVAILFGFVGFVLRKLDYPLAPIALTMIVGPMLENALRQSLTISQGDIMVLFRGPLSSSMLIAAAVVLTLPLWRFGAARVRGRFAPAAGD